MKNQGILYKTMSVIALTALLFSAQSIAQNTNILTNPKAGISSGDYPLSNQGTVSTDRQKEKAIDSTSIYVSKNSNSICKTLDGIPIDGSVGTPSTPPYNKGNWYQTIQAVSLAFGGRPIVQNGGLCLTNCPINTIWNGSMCAPIAPTCVAGTAVTTAACGSGYNGGTKSATTTTTCPSGPYGAPNTSTGAYNLSACIVCPSNASSSFTPSCPPNYTGATNSGVNTTSYSCATGSAVATTSTTNAGTCNLNTPTCSAGTSSNTVACGAGYNGGTKTATTTITCPSGVYGAPTTSTGPYNTSSCVACPSATLSNFTPSCSSGYTGVTNSGIYTTSYSCASGSAVGSVSTSNPGTCTPIPVSCTAGVVTTACGAGYDGGTRTSTTTCPSGPYGSASTSTTSSCVACPSDTFSYSTPSCSSGYTAVANSIVDRTSYSCASGYASGSTSRINNGTCTANPVTCSPSSSSTPCGSGYNGGSKTTTTSCPSGAYGSPSTSTSTSSCIACPSPTTASFTPSCAPNYTATANSGIRTTTYSCASGSAVGSTTTTNPGICTYNTPTPVYRVDRIEIWANYPGNRCAFEVWDFKYKDNVKYAEELVTSSPGSTAGGWCELY